MYCHLIKVGEKDDAKKSGEHSIIGHGSDHEHSHEVHSESDEDAEGGPRKRQDH